MTAKNDCLSISKTTIMCLFATIALQVTPAFADGQLTDEPTTGGAAGAPIYGGGVDQAPQAGPALPVCDETDGRPPTVYERAFGAIAHKHDMQAMDDRQGVAVNRALGWYAGRNKKTQDTRMYNYGEKIYQQVEKRSWDNADDMRAYKAWSRDREDKKSGCKYKAVRGEDTNYREQYEGNYNENYRTN